MQRLRRQAFLISVSSLRIVNTQSWQLVSCTCWAEKDQGPSLPPSISDSSTTELSWRTLLFVQVCLPIDLVISVLSFEILCHVTRRFHCHMFVSSVSAAVSALAKFGGHCDDLLPSIVVLLKRYVLVAKVDYLCQIFVRLKSCWVINVEFISLCNFKPQWKQFLFITRLLAAWLSDVYQ